MYNPDYDGVSHSLGWECPRCGRINAPWMNQCTCEPIKTTVTAGTGPSVTSEDKLTLYDLSSNEKFEDLLRKLME